MGLRQSQRKKRKVILSPVSGLVPLKKSKIQMTKARVGCCRRAWFGFHFKEMLTPKVALPCPALLPLRHTTIHSLQAYISTSCLLLTSV